MPQKGFSVLILIFIVGILLGILGTIYYLNLKKDNPNQLLQRPKINSQLKDLETIPSNTASSPSSNTALSNPASEYCIKVGGTLEAQTRGDGGEYSICNFADDQSCEEWALYRRNCPIGGIKTIGFDTPEEIYCAQIGGKTTATTNSSCTLPNGDVCSNENLYNGKCQ